MSKLSTHILDTANGKPAGGVKIVLFRSNQQIVSVVTNSDGRTDSPLLNDQTIAEGIYRIEFYIGDYFSALGHCDAKRFLDVIPIVFKIDDPTRGYHVPLLVSPWSYSTYRGS